MKPFENFDWDNFWHDSEYAWESYIGKEPTDEEIKSVEEELGYKLPDSYIEMIKHHNGGIPIYDVFEDIDIVGIFGIDRSTIYSLCGEIGSKFMISEWGYPNIGIAVADTISGGHDMIFLDYRECGKDGEPKVVHVDQECDYRITPLADSFEEFIRGLKEPSSEITNNKFLALSEDEQFNIISNLNESYEAKRVIELLNSTGVENLDSKLLSELARAYNNNDEMEKAMEIMDIIPEDERDDRWYYRYGYSFVYREFPNSSYEDNLNGLFMFEKAMDISKDKKIKKWCSELVEVCKLGIILESKKDKMPLLYEYCVQNNIKLSDEDNKLTYDAEKQGYRDDISYLDSVNWIFDKHKYSREEFSKKFNEVMTEYYGIKWWDTNINGKIEESDILITYEAWIGSTEQLHDNEILDVDYELTEENKEDGMWQVDITAYLKSDNGEYFSLEELMYKLQNLMADVELGDHIFFEGLEYRGYYWCGLCDDDKWVHSFYVVCGS